MAPNRALPRALLFLPLLLACGEPAPPATLAPDPATGVRAPALPTASAPSLAPLATPPATKPTVGAGTSAAASDATAPAPPATTAPAATAGAGQTALDADAAARFREAIRSVVRMPRDHALQQLAREHRMRLVNLTWEDTGRFIGSAVGPNISDLTLELVERREGKRPRNHLLPVLRYPNFTDRTADVPAERFVVRVGNEREGRPLRTVRLDELLAHLPLFLSDPEAFRGRSSDFTAPRDTHYLVSAQHVFVPAPERVRVELAPMLFNYQSAPGSPAVLVLLATREGTRIPVIEHREDATIPGGGGQRLYFNRAGRRTTFTAERRSDVAARIERGDARAEDATALDEGSDMVMIVQVPLVVPVRRRMAPSDGFFMNPYGGAGIGSGAGYGAGSGRGASDVERAVVGHGLDEGPFAELRRQRIRRDPRFPIRVTIQFYRATSNGVLSPADVEAAAAQIERVYADADFVGSLVVGSQARPTSWTEFMEGDAVEAATP